MFYIPKAHKLELLNGQAFKSNYVVSVKLILICVTEH